MTFLKSHRVLEYFDYEKSKENFLRLQYNYIERKKKGIIAGKVHFWTREKVDIYIDIILRYKKKNESYLEDEEMAKYDVVKLNGVYKLVLRRKTYRGQRIEVVPFEDCFDKIMLVHRQLGHNTNLSKMIYKIITRKYVIDKIWVFLIQRSCNFCKSSKEIDLLLKSEKSMEKSTKSNRIYQIMITPVKISEKEQEQKMLMIVADRISNFVFLRPLSTLDANNITIELIKIFTDYGFPKLLETKETVIFEKVIKLLSKFNRECKLHLINIPHKNSPIWFTRVMIYLKEWMDVNECTNWNSGCPIVQWQLNTLRRHDNSTPYTDVFNMEPVRDLIVG